MSKKATIIIVIALAAMLLFSACERSAQSSLATPTAVPTSLTAQPTNLSLVQAWGTKTAMYVNTMVALGTFTPVPSTPQATATPLPPGTVAATSVLPATGAPTTAPVTGLTPVIIVATPTPGHPSSYTLQSGEFPYCIARRFNVDPNDLLAANGLSSGQVLQPGLHVNHPCHRLLPGCTRPEQPPGPVHCDGG